MDLSRYIRVYDGDLDADLCDQLVQAFDEAEPLQRRNGRGVRAGLEASAWTELDLPQIADDSVINFFRRKIDLALSRYNRDVQQPIAVPHSGKTAEWVLKRYRPGGAEGFQLHFDSIHAVANRYLVFLWYLNNVMEGGTTDFPELDLRIDARRGRLLMFPPYWMFQHVGQAPRLHSKYILSTYLLF